MEEQAPMDWKSRILKLTNIFKEKHDAILGRAWSNSKKLVKGLRKSPILILKDGKGFKGDHVKLVSRSQTLYLTAMLGKGLGTCPHIEPVL